MSVFLPVATLFLLMLCGFFSAKRKLVDEHGVAALNKIVLTFALPALTLSSMQTSASPELIRNLLLVFVLSCVLMLLCGVVAYFLFGRETLARRGVLTNLSMLSNCAFMGYPVVIATLGQDALIIAVMYSAAFNLMVWTAGSFFFGGVRAMEPKRLLTNPPLLAVVGGLVLLLTGWHLPGFLNDALEMLGNLTTPLAMFIIGARLVDLRLSHLTDKSLLFACVLRLVLFPALVLLLRLTPMPDEMVQVMFLCTAMPCAATTAMQSEMFPCDQALASRGVALSTAFSILTLPIMLMLL